jgi:hypothetical protein
MLRASWDILVAFSDRFPEEFGADRPCGAIASRISLSAPWLTWTVREAHDEEYRTEALMDVLGSFMEARARTLVREPEALVSSAVEQITDVLGAAVDAARDFGAGIDNLFSTRGSSGPRGGTRGRASRSSSARPRTRSAPASGSGGETRRAAPPLDTHEKAELSRSLGLPEPVLDEMLRKLRS